MAEPPHRVKPTDAEAKTEAAPLSALGAGAPPDSLAPDAPPLVAGRYEILGLLGSGGMGTVYRARDRELDEVVALKVLKKELALAPGMLERFRREVKLARRVTHKNVARTFDIGEHDGDRFITMELIDGEMLGALLERLGRVPLAEVVTIGRDVCAALSSAHAAGVLHRDLKPENVILARDGRAVITDFGIARAVAQGERARTAAGIVGTPAYMAPEQVEGADDLDGRADLYALGAMLFELLTGEPAWGGDSIIAIAAARLLRPPPDPRAIMPELPVAAAAVVQKLMARQRADRYATADDAADALAALTASPTSARGIARLVASEPPPALPSYVPGASTEVHLRRKTIAVLPLANLGVADDQYLAQTLTEDIIDLLSVVPALRVRPRGDTAAREGSAPRDAREVGRELGVDVVVDGSVRRLESMVRVSVRLVTVEDGFQLWARRFDVPAGRVQTVADDAAAAIARALATEVTAEARPVTSDPVAQELFLRGRYLLDRGWFEVAREGVEKLRAAHERAPEDTRIAGTYALAMARFRATATDAAAAGAEARAIAERTLLADPTQAQACVALGFVHLNEGELVGAAVQLKSALTIAPNSFEALDAVGRLLLEVGHVESGIRTLRRALAIEPSLVHCRHAMARAQALIGDDDGSRETLGPLPSDRGALSAYLLVSGRIALWRKDRSRAAQLMREVDRGGLSVYATQSVRGLLDVACHGAAPQGIDLDGALPMDTRYPPRRLSFHAQIRAELRLAIGDVEGGLLEIRASDANGLVDLLWLDRCPLFDGLRQRPEMIAIRESTAQRAKRIVDVLDPGKRLARQA